jgi:hypothetical protein
MERVFADFDRFAAERRYGLPVTDLKCRHIGARFAAHNDLPTRRFRKASLRSSISVMLQIGSTALVQLSLNPFVSG